jgi:hypothetical protein
MRFLIQVLDDGQARDAGRTASATPAEQAAVEAFNDRLRGEGAWILAAGLAAPAESVVIDARLDDPVTTHGPAVSAGTHVAGFWVIEAPDGAYARVLAAAGSRACGRRVELRPFL